MAGTNPALSWAGRTPYSPLPTLLLTMADDLFPDSVKDFVFDLHDASRRSFISSEQLGLYQTIFREITAKYFPNTAWPSTTAIASECGNDPLFLALYDELTLRHLHSVKRPSVRDRIEGWHVYKKLFDLILAEASAIVLPPEGGQDEDGGVKETLHLVPEWCFDILHEFLYQFQGFCQFRSATYIATAKFTNSSTATATTTVSSSPDPMEEDGTQNSGNNGGGGPPAHILDAIDVLSENKDAWAVESVLTYLHRLVLAGTTTKSSSSGRVIHPVYRYLAYFASVTLSRLECLLGDYRASIMALDVIYDPHADLVPVGEEMKSPEGLVNGVFPARLSLTYHAGVSYLMLRRYADSASVLGGICLFMQRGFKTGQLRKIPGSEQFNKLYDRMLALLAILSHVCPKSVVDDAIASVVREKYSNNLSKIETGEEGYEDLFVFACPKFVNPAVPDYARALRPGCPVVPYGHDAYKLQVQHFMSEMAAHATLRKMRSYMSLYTSIEVEKLASFNDMKVDEFGPWLTCFKHKMRQLERGVVGAAEKGVIQGGVSSEMDRIGTALDIHFYVLGNVVHVDEAEKTRRFETFFMKQIKNNDDILRQLDNIKIEM